MLLFQQALPAPNPKLLPAALFGASQTCASWSKKYAEAARPASGNTWRFSHSPADRILQARDGVSRNLHQTESRRRSRSKGISKHSPKGRSQPVHFRMSTFFDYLDNRSKLAPPGLRVNSILRQLHDRDQQASRSSRRICTCLAEVISQIRKVTGGSRIRPPSLQLGQVKPAGRTTCYTKWRVWRFCFGPFITCTTDAHPSTSAMPLQGGTPGSGKK